MASTAYLAAGKFVSKNVYEMRWVNTAGTTGAGHPLDAPNLPDKTLFIQGPTTGAGTSRVVIEGTSVTGAPSVVPWTTLTSPTDGQLDFTALPTTAIVRVIRENPLRIRPRYHTVTGGAIIPVVIVCR